MAALVPELSSHILSIVVLLYNSAISEERRYEYNFSDFEECEDVAKATDYRGTLSDPSGPVTVEIKAGCIKDGIRVTKGEVSRGGLAAEPFFEPSAGLDVGFAWEGFSVAATFSTSGGGGGGSFSFGGFPSGVSGSVSGGSGRGVGASFFTQGSSPFVPPSPPNPCPAWPCSGGAGAADRIPPMESKVRKQLMWMLLALVMLTMVCMWALYLAKGMQ